MFPKERVQSRSSVLAERWLRNLLMYRTFLLTFDH